MVCPRLVFFHAGEEGQREALLRHAERNGTTVVSYREAEKVFEKREMPVPSDPVAFLTQVIFCHLEKSHLMVLDFPSTPDHFHQL